MISKELKVEEYCIWKRGEDYNIHPDLEEALSYRKNATMIAVNP